MININNVSKHFVLHNQGGIIIPVMQNATLSVQAGECIALVGFSGSGKSTLMRMIYGNYFCQSGEIEIDGLNLMDATPREVISLRKNKLGYVSQFLRVVPRVSTRNVVAEPLLALGQPLE